MNAIARLQDQLNVQYNAQDWTAALETCWQITTIVGYNADVMALIAELGAKTAHPYIAARRLVDYAVKLATENKLIIAKRLIEHQQFAAAIRLYKTIEEETHGDIDITDAKRHALYLAGRWTEALTYMEAYKDKGIGYRFEYAKVLPWLFDEKFFEAEPELDYCMDRLPLDVGSLRSFALFYHLVGAYEKAAQCALKGAALSTVLFEKMKFYQHAIICLEALDLTTDRIQLAKQALAQLRSMEQQARTTPQWQEFLGFLAIFTYFADDPNWPSLLKRDQAVAQLNPSGFADVSPDKVEFLQKWRHKLSGKDVFIVLPGPSTEELSKYIHHTKNKDVVFATVNKLLQVNDMLLPDQEVSILAMAAKEHLSSEDGNFLFDYLKDDQERMLLMHSRSAASIDHIPHGIGFQAPFIIPPGQDHVIRADAPLTFMGINGLSMLMMILVILQPKRIFIFGADGESASHQDYFFSGGEKRSIHRFDNMEAAKSEARHIKLKIDNDKFNFLMPFLLEAIAALYDVPVPKVINVGLGSKLRVFEKMSYAEAFDYWAT